MTPDKWADEQDEALQRIVLESARDVAKVQRALLLEFRRYLAKPKQPWGAATAADVRWELGQHWARKVPGMASRAWERTKKAVRTAWEGVGRILTSAKDAVLGPPVVSGDIVGDSLLRRYARSFARYGAMAVRDVERVIAGMPGGMSWQTARERIWKAVRRTVRDRQWMVDRILRTEVSHAYHAAQHQAILAVDARDSAKKRRTDPLMRVNVAIFDSRTAKDSFTVHGQVRRPNEPFFNAGLGVSFLHPPDRPNDRSTVVPWRRSWGPTVAPAP